MKTKDMQTEVEYKDALMNCVMYKGWDVLADALSLLQNYQHNLDVIIDEIRAERRAIRKALDSDMSNKKKVEFIEAFAKDWRQKGTSDE